MRESMYCKHCGAVLADDALFCEKCGAIIASRARTGQKVTEERDAAEEADRTEPAFQRAAEEADRTEAGSGRTAKEANQMSVESASPQGKTEWADAALQEADKAAEQGTDANISQRQEHMPQAEPERASYPPKHMPQTGPEQVSQPQEHMPQAGPEQAGLPQNMAPQAGPEQAGMPQNPQNTPAKKKGKPLVIIAACIVIAAVIAAAALMGGQEKPLIKADLMSQNNFNNGAIFAYDDSHLYFVADYEGESLENDLYSTDYDGNSKKLLFSDGYVRKVRVTDGKVLFTYTDKEDSDHFYIGMIDPDGAEAVTSTDLEAEITDYDLNGKELLYLADEELHSCSLDGSNDKVLLSGVKKFVNAGSMLYYASSDGVYSYTRKKEKSTKLFDGEISELCCGDGRFYFRRDDAYFLTDTEGNEKKLVDDKLVHFMLFKGEYIYFIRMFDKGKLDVLLGQGWEDTDSKYLVGVGTPIRIPKEGGALEDLGDKSKEDIIVGTTIFGYPDGMYTRGTIVLNTLTPVENVPAE